MTRNERTVFLAVAASILALCLIPWSCSQPLNPNITFVAPDPPAPVVKSRRLMVCSWYGAQYHGRITASGEVFDKNKFTAAHRWLPFGTILHLSLGERRVWVRVTDRGPFHPDRELDLSEAAALALGITKAGTAVVYVEEMQ